MAFYRGLMIFDKCVWMNHPQATYLAESKPYQLYLAKKIGFRIPQTLITNTDILLSDYFGCNKTIIAKGIDTVLLQMKKHRAFVYANVVKISELTRAKLAIAPVMFQKYLKKKIDIRVTIVNRNIFAVQITRMGKGIQEDWRLAKDSVEYLPITLPAAISKMCTELIKQMGLSFGAIDLVKVDGKYYFLEVNPTGEWGWLVNKARLPIDSAIADFLTGQ